MDRDWWQALRARADRAPLRPRDPLLGPVGGAIGSIEPAVARRMVSAGLPLVAAEAGGWRVAGASLDATFAAFADWLRDAGLASAWRNELLAVDDDTGRRVGLIERAAVRPLGMATRAVHLVGWAEAGGMWVQQRAFDKATDPGQWDTLVGGLMAGDEDIALTLERETWEEAGLRVAALRELRPADDVVVRRPVDHGYMIERIHVREALIPTGLAPQNQDGEVADFECLSRDALRERLHAGAFTLEAALILADACERQRDAD